jgi:hypothetical protein
MLGTQFIQERIRRFLSTHSQKVLMVRSVERSRPYHSLETQKAQRGYNLKP